MSSDSQARVVERSGDSDPGVRRATNQDRFLAEAPLFVVADGMGGHLGGEVAAALAIEVFRDHAALHGHIDVAAGLGALVAEANRRIYAESKGKLEYKGMGTTVIAALVHDDAVTLAHVGDSRAYRLRDGELEVLTSDHSYVNELLQMGALTPEEAERHPHASVITRALGTREEVEPDIETHRVRDHDVFLLCSDGLTKMVPEAEITAIVAAAKRLDDASERLIATANEKGGEDNITVCMFRVSLPEQTGRKQTTVIDLSVIARVATAERRLK
ncbi:MAG: family protein phosphatase [Thermoleophilales bacterium]|nr:family protein phosphatase [Thermoleophilales bacterium]